MSLFGLLLAQPGRLHLIEFTENDIKLRGIRSSKRQLKHIIYLMNFQIGFLKNMDQFVSASQCSPHRNRYSMHSNNCFFFVIFISIALETLIWCFQHIKLKLKQSMHEMWMFFLKSHWRCISGSVGGDDHCARVFICSANVKAFFPSESNKLTKR